MRRHLTVLGAGVVLLTTGLAAGGQAVKGAPSAEALGWRLGAQAYSFRQFTFFEAVDRTAGLGLKWVEAYPGQRLSADLGDATMGAGLSAEFRQKIREKLGQAGVKLVSFGVVGLPNQEAECRKVFDFARDMGIETICSEPPREAFPLLDRLCGEYGISVAVHNHPQPSAYALPDAVLQACEGCGPRLGSCADTGHWMRSGVVPVDALRKLQGRLISFHLKEVDRQAPDAHDVPWGTGAAQMRAILEELKRQGVGAVISIEYESHPEDPVPDMARCVEFIETVAAELSKPQ